VHPPDKNKIELGIIMFDVVILDNSDEIRLVFSKTDLEKFNKVLEKFNWHRMFKVVNDNFVLTKAAYYTEDLKEGYIVSNIALFLLTLDGVQQDGNERDNFAQFKEKVNKFCVVTRRTTLNEIKTNELLASFEQPNLYGQIQSTRDYVLLSKLFLKDIHKDVNPEYIKELENQLLSYSGTDEYYINRVLEISQSLQTMIKSRGRHETFWEKQYGSFRKSCCL
jgi:hypothetical protein